MQRFPFAAREQHRSAAQQHEYFISVIMTLDLLQILSVAR
jgi:hypothetical protein